VHLSSALRGLFSADRGTSRLAEGYGAAGQPDEGLRQLDEATRHMDATQERWHEADVHRVRGQLLFAVGDPWPKQASAVTTSKIVTLDPLRSRHWATNLRRLTSHHFTPASLPDSPAVVAIWSGFLYLARTKRPTPYKPIENNPAEKIPIENTPTAKVPAANMPAANSPDAKTPRANSPAAK